MTVGGVDLFLPMPEPLPAGTVLTLGTDKKARVEKVLESADPTVAGVYVKLLAEGEAEQAWVPAFREAEVPLPRPPVVVVSPMVVRPVHAPISVHTPAASPAYVSARPEPAPEPRAPVSEAAPPVVVAPAPQEERPATIVVAAPPPVQVELVEHPEHVEHAKKGRRTIQVSVPPPAEVERDDQRGVPGKVEAVGEIDTGRRVIRSAQPSVESAGHRDLRPETIVIASDPQPEEGAPEAVSPEFETSAAVAASEASKASEGPVGDLPPARPLPPDKRRATRSRRRPTQR